MLAAKAFMRTMRDGRNELGPVGTLTEVLASIGTVGRATDTPEPAAALVDELRGRLQQIAAAVATMK